MTGTSTARPRRHAETQRLLRFLVVGAIGAAVNLASLTLLVGAGVDKYLASPISIELAIVSNFLLHQSWTFADRRAPGVAWWARGLKFKTVALMALAASYATFVLLSLAIPGIPPLVAQAIGILPGTAVNYLCNAHWTFRAPRAGAVPTPGSTPAAR